MNTPRTDDDLSELGGYVTTYVPSGPASPLMLLLRGLRLRCPNCGQGKLFKRGYTMYERCSVCGWVFEREEGYWTGAMAVNLIVTEVFALVAVVAFSVAQTPLWLTLGIGLPATAALPFLFYWHAKSFWMSIDFMIHPAETDAGR